MTNAERQRRYRKRRRARRKFFSGAGNDSKFMGWQTPADLGGALSDAVGGFDLDPCSSTTDPAIARVRARRLLTFEHDGLSAEWSGHRLLQPTIWPSPAPLGGQVRRGGRPRPRSGGGAGAGEDRHEVVARPRRRRRYLHVARPAALRGWQAVRTVPERGGRLGANLGLTARVAAALPGAWHVGGFRYAGNRYELPRLEAAE